MKKFEFISLPTPKKGQLHEESSIKATREHNILSESTRMCVDLENPLAEKIKDYAYWEGLTQHEILLQALQNFMQDKAVKTRPEAVKNRKSPGRKRKN